MVKVLSILIFLIVRSTFSLEYGGEELPQNIEKLSEKLRDQIFQNNDFKLTAELLTSSSTHEVSSFIDALEKTSDPESIRPYLNYLSESEGTQIRFLEVLKERVSENPELLRKITITLRELKGEMKKANLRFPIPIRCTAGIATYIGMQDWYLSYKSSFFHEKDLEYLYKEQIVDPSYKLLIGFVLSACLGDAIASSKNAKEYFKELKVDKNVEKARLTYFLISKDLESSREEIINSKSTIDSLIYIDQNVTEIAKQLSHKINIKSKKQKERFIKGIKGSYFSYLKTKKHKKIDKHLKKLKREAFVEKEKDVILLEHLTEDFSNFLSTYKETNKGILLKEIQGKYEKELNNVIKNNQPSKLTKACFVGLGVATTLIGLHASAGRNETNVDDLLTKNIRKYYDDYSYIFMTALVSPCVWQVNHLPKILIKAFKKTYKKKIMNENDLKIAKRALFKSDAKRAIDKSNFSRPTDIIDYAMNPFLAKNKLYPIPSLACLEHLSSFSRRPASISSSCINRLKSIFSKRKKKRTYIDLKYENIAQIRAYNKLAEELELKKRYSPDVIYKDITQRAEILCD